MSNIILDECLDSNEYINMIADNDICDGVFPLMDLTYWQNIACNDYKHIDNDLWDYPLTEIDHIIENDIKVVLVKFTELYGGYEYRFCEVL